MANRPSEEELAKLTKLAGNVFRAEAWMRVWDLKCGRIGVKRKLAFRRLLREELYSERFAEFIRAAACAPSPSPFAEIVRRSLGRRLQVTTTAGTVEGIVAEAEAGCAVLAEPQGTTVTVNYRQTVAIQPDLTEEEPI